MGTPGRRVLLAVLSLMLAGGFSALAGYFLFLNFEPDRSVYPVLGIDVSHHQGKIDWDAVSNSDVSFAYIKATEGGDWKDRKFAENWRESRLAGIRRGAYHFFTFCKSGAEQAQNFTGSVVADPDSLPPAIDLEFGGNCKNIPSPDIVMAEVSTFIKVIQNKYGVIPVLYVTKEFYEAYSEYDLMKKHPLWVRSIIFSPEYSKVQWKIWQFHNRARRNGITGPVDLNVLKDKNIDNFINSSKILN